MRAPAHADDITVLRSVERHAELESEVLDEYRRVAARPSTPESVRYLVQLILEDEERHHRLFAELANALRSVIWEVPVEPAMPATGPQRNTELHDATRRLLEFEREDARELRALRTRLRHTNLPPMYELAVNMMLHDTDKHIDMLRFVADRTR